MLTYQEYLEEKDICSLISTKQIDDLEKFADKLLDKFGIDIEFTKHFGDRMSDSRNSPCIKISELQKLFKKISKDKGQRIKSLSGDDQAVLVDMQTDLNLPFVVEPKSNGELELRMKTIMRKHDFKTSNPKVVYEQKSNWKSTTSQNSALSRFMKGLKIDKEDKDDQLDLRAVKQPDEGAWVIELRVINARTDYDSGWNYYTDVVIGPRGKIKN